MAEWQKGRSIDDLRAIRELYRQHDGSIPLGAFSAMKENSIAASLEDGTMMVWRSGSQPVAAMECAQIRQRRSVKDFRGQIIGQMEPGSRLIRRMACAPGFERALAQEIARFVPIGESLWIEIWQEHPVESAIVRDLGFHWYGSKIKASSEIVGVYSGGFAANQLTSPHDRFGLVRFGGLAFDPAPIMQEISDQGLIWADHYASYNKRKSWSALCLRGFGGDPDFIIKPSEMSKQWKAENPEKMGWQPKETELARSLPLTRELADLIPGEKQRIRLMRLAPGNGELTRHADITDPEAGASIGQLMRIHFPIATNPEVIFRSWMPDGIGEIAHMGAGEVWSLDTRKPHTARNDGPSERIHLVVDVYASEALLAMSVLPASSSAPQFGASASRLGSIAQPMERWIL